MVIDYKDEAVGTMEESADGSGRFKEVILHLQILIADQATYELAESLHQEANKMCFIANSLNFPVKHQPVISY